MHVAMYKIFTASIQGASIFLSSVNGRLRNSVKKVSVLTCTPNLAPAYISNVLNLYTKGALESLSRQIEALSFPYSSSLLQHQMELWTESSLDKIQMVVELVRAKMDAMMAIRGSPGAKWVFSLQGFL